MKYTLVILLSIFTVLTSCEQKIDYAGVFEIEALDNDTVRICNSRSGYKKSAGEYHLSGVVKIPTAIYGKQVVEIGKKAFYGCSDVKEFIIPNTVKIIDEEAFKGCTSLRKIFIPKSVTKIASNTFYECSSLQTIDVEDIAAWRGYRFYLSDVRYITIDASEPEPPSITEEENHSMKDTTYSVNGVHFTMKPIVAVTDAVIGDNSRIDNKEHTVSLSTYYIGETEVTQELWQAVMGGNPSYFKDSDKKPVEQVSWFDCIKFCNELTAEVMGAEHCVYKINGEKVTADFSKKGFRLPTEAEWEYAAMGGKSLHKYAGCNSENDLKDYAWYKDNSDNKTHKVKTKKPNGYGLYDMSGNIWEWCWGWWTVTTPSGGSNPHGADSGDYRVWRGGSFAFNASYCERAYRGYIDPDNSGVNLGLRLVMSSN